MRRRSESKIGGEGMDDDTPNAAPGPLRLVQGFLNTLDVEPDTDELADVKSAAAWLRSAGFADHLSPKRLSTLRDLRDAVRALVELDPAQRLPTATWRRLNELAGRIHVQPEVTRGGEIELAVQGRGLEKLVAALLLAIHQAAADGSWERLNTCRRCEWAYFDVTKNRSAVWCSRRCSQRAKASRYYARRKRVSAHR
jgi:predicted RNA-binding Zn ribbon-like protein